MPHTIYIQYRWIVDWWHLRFHVECRTLFIINTAELLIDDILDFMLNVECRTLFLLRSHQINFDYSRLFISLSFVDRTCHSVNGGSLEITCTVPLIIVFKNNFSIFFHTRASLPPESSRQWMVLLTPWLIKLLLINLQNGRQQILYVLEIADFYMG